VPLTNDAHGMCVCEAFKSDMKRSVESVHGKMSQRTLYVLPACLSRLGSYSAHGLTVRERYESAMFEAAYAHGEIPGC